MAQSHTPQDCCVRFAVVVAFHAATLATGRALPLTRTGLSPVGTRQLSWRTKDWPLPASLERVRRKLQGFDDGDRQMVKILSAVLSDGLAAVEAACAAADEAIRQRPTRNANTDLIALRNSAQCK